MKLWTLSLYILLASSLFVACVNEGSKRSPKPTTPGPTLNPDPTGTSDKTGTGTDETDDANPILDLYSPTSSSFSKQTFCQKIAEDDHNAVWTLHEEKCSRLVNLNSSEYYCSENNMTYNPFEELCIFYSPGSKTFSEICESLDGEWSYQEDLKQCLSADSTVMTAFQLCEAFSKDSVTHLSTSSCSEIINSMTVEEACEKHTGGACAVSPHDKNIYGKIEADQDLEGYCRSKGSAWAMDDSGRCTKDNNGSYGLEQLCEIENRKSSEETWVFNSAKQECNKISTLKPVADVCLAPYSFDSVTQSCVTFRAGEGSSPSCTELLGPEASFDELTGTCYTSQQSLSLADACINATAGTGRFDTETNTCYDSSEQSIGQNESLCLIEGIQWIYDTDSKQCHKPDAYKLLTEYCDSLSPKKTADLSSGTCREINKQESIYDYCNDTLGTPCLVIPGTDSIAYPDDVLEPVQACKQLKAEDFEDENFDWSSNICSPDSSQQNSNSNSNIGHVIKMGVPIASSRHDVSDKFEDIVCPDKYGIEELELQKSTWVEFDEEGERQEWKGLSWIKLRCINPQDQRTQVELGHKLPVGTNPTASAKCADEESIIVGFKLYHNDLIDDLDISCVKNTDISDNSEQLQEKLERNEITLPEFEEQLKISYTNAKLEDKPAFGNVDSGSSNTFECYDEQSSDKIPAGFSIAQKIEPSMGYTAFTTFELLCRKF